MTNILVQIVLCFLEIFPLILMILVFWIMFGMKEDEKWIQKQERKEELRELAKAINISWLFKKKTKLGKYAKRIRENNPNSEFPFSDIYFNAIAFLIAFSLSFIVMGLCMIILNIGIDLTEEVMSFLIGLSGFIVFIMFIGGCLFSFWFDSKYVSVIKEDG